jgi:hypothetical protein
MPSLFRRAERNPVPAQYAALNPAKLGVIDRCFTDLGCRSFVDLGGVWAVDGGYSLYAADVHAAESGLLVDDDFTDRFLDRSRDFPRLEHLRGNFGDRELIAGLGEYDAALFFDVLLHQVDPDWDEILAEYRRVARCIAIVQPQWNGPSTLRLLDLGEDDYLKTVPSDHVVYEGLFSRLDDINPRRSKPWRDVHDIWQWGITDDDLVTRMAQLGFELRHREIGGPWRGLESFHESSFVFEHR